MRDKTSNGKKPVSIFAFLEEVNAACDSCDIHQERQLVYLYSIWLVHLDLSYMHMSVYRLRLLRHKKGAYRHILLLSTISLNNTWGTKTSHQSTSTRKASNSKIWRQTITPNSYGRRLANAHPSRLSRCRRTILLRLWTRQYVDNSPIKSQKISRIH